MRRGRVTSPGEHPAQLSHEGLGALRRIDVELEPGDTGLAGGVGDVRGAVQESEHDRSEDSVVAVVLERRIERRPDRGHLRAVDDIGVWGSGALGTGEGRREGGAEDRGQTLHESLRVMPQYRCYCSPPEGATAARTTTG